MSYCFICDGTGKYYQPVNQEANQSDPGVASDKQNGISEENAKRFNRKSNYIVIDCPNCNGGHSNR
jgi:hypothetical protein